MDLHCWKCSEEEGKGENVTGNSPFSGRLSMHCSGADNVPNKRMQLEYMIF